MASAEEQAKGRVKSTRKAGSTGTPGRLTTAFGSGNGAAGATELFWDDVDPRLLCWVVVEATAIGGAVTYGRSRDGGALMVTVLLDGERETKWISPRDDPADVLTHLAETLNTLR